MSFKYPDLSGRIKLSGLPDLSETDNTFTGILCSAVLQHIPDTDLYESFRRIRELTAEKGIFIVSFPVEYPGIDPKTNRDAKGRFFYIRQEEKYRFLIERMGFNLLEVFRGMIPLREMVSYGKLLFTEKKTRQTLFSAFNETIEINAEQRSVKRWEV